jgi:hypothetical protein
VQKKSLRTCNDRANGNELDGMNSREPVWSEPGKSPHRPQNGISPLRKNSDPLPHRFSPGDYCDCVALYAVQVRGVQTRQNDQSRSVKQGLNTRPPPPKESHSMPNITANLLAATVSCALLNVFPAAAQQQGPSRIRGTIESVDGNNLTVTARDGTTQKIGLASDVVVTGLVKTTLADVKPGSYIGVTGMPLADGSQKAIAIHIFPESARGTAEGFRQYDLRPNSTMTNATVAQEVDANDGKSLSVKYKGGEKKVVVSPDTPIVNFVDGAKSELKAGAKIIAFVAKQSDGTLSSKRVLVGRDGITPPM